MVADGEWAAGLQRDGARRATSAEIVSVSLRSTTLGCPGMRPFRRSTLYG